MGLAGQGDHITEGLTFLVDGFVGFPQLRIERKAEGVTSGEGQQSARRESLVGWPGGSSWNKTQSGRKQEIKGKGRWGPDSNSLPG